MELSETTVDALRGFCDLILCGHREDVFCRCKECMEQSMDGYGGIPDILYLLSGNDISLDDKSKQLLKPQYHLVSSDAGAPELEDFFWFVDNLKEARGLDFALDPKKFDRDDCIIEWLAELASQLKDLYITDFQDDSEDYHFVIMDKKDSEKALGLFREMTAHIKRCSFRCGVITSDFEG